VLQTNAQALLQTTMVTFSHLMHSYGTAMPDTFFYSKLLAMATRRDTDDFIKSLTEEKADVEKLRQRLARIDGQRRRKRIARAKKRDQMRRNMAELKGLDSELGELDTQAEELNQQIADCEELECDMDLC